MSGLAALAAGRLGDSIPKWKVLVGGYALGLHDRIHPTSGPLRAAKAIQVPPKK